MKLISIYLDKPGGYYKKDKYRPHIIEEQFYSRKTKDKEEAISLIKELTAAACREVHGFEHDPQWGGLYFGGNS